MKTLTAPAALTALSRYPYLHAQARAAMTRQSRRVMRHAAHVVQRTLLLDALDSYLPQGGLIALEGQPGAGVTALLCMLAATRRAAFWLPDGDPIGGLAALCAQVIALNDLTLPLLPPTAGRDAQVLERLLEEAAPRYTPDDPFLVLIDRAADERITPIPISLPIALPPNVALILAIAPGASLPLPATARIPMPFPSEPLEGILAQLARHTGCQPNDADIIAHRSDGSFPYVRIAARLVASGARSAADLPYGLEAFCQSWWDRLSHTDRQIATLVAAAGDYVDPAFLARVGGFPEAYVKRWVRTWGAFLDIDGDRVQLAHPEVARFVARRTGDDLAGAHAAYVRLTWQTSNDRPESSLLDNDTYLAQQFARHIARCPPDMRAQGVRTLENRAWVVAQERRTGTMRTAANDIAWLIGMLSHDGQILRLVRAAALGGTLSLLARTLPPDAPAEIFARAIERGAPREATLRRLRAMLDDMPDSSDKALALRQLGEVCYALRMRIPAMRMLSEALDIEAPGLPRSWREERDELMVALSRAATAIGQPDVALAITARIQHPRRRALIETEVVRWLIAHGQRTRAEEVAYAMAHDGTHEWAMAEVAIGHARAGDEARMAVVLSTLKSETALAWAIGELACDAARTRAPLPQDRILRLPAHSQIDRVLASVALVLGEVGYAEAGHTLTSQIQDAQLRARTRIELALRHPEQAEPMLQAAAQDAHNVEGEERATLVATLAAAQAELGDLGGAVQTAGLLPPGEERDRAQSRIACGLARRGDFDIARAIASEITDQDEQSWALDELARRMADAGRWREAFALAAQIGEPEQRSRTEADLTITWARSGEPVAAHARADQIGMAAERNRAQIAIIGALVAAGARARVFATVSQFQDPSLRSRYAAAAAAALAAHGAMDEASTMVAYIPRPLDRARALVALARAAALSGDVPTAQQHLGAALRIVAILGRSETFACFGWAAEVLAALGPDLLLTTAAALDELDGWWAR